MDFGEAAKPGVDLVEAGIAAVQEGESSSSGVAHGLNAAFGNRTIHEADDGLGLVHVAVKGIGGDEVYQRSGVLHVLAEVGPARVARQADGFAEVVQRGQTDITAAGDVDRCEIERLAEQALVQRRGDEFVHLVHLLVRHAEQDRGRSDLAVLVGIEEGVAKGITHDLAGEAAGGINGVDGLAKRRVAEAESALGVFKRDAGVFVRRVADEFLDVGRDVAGVLVDGRVLILHFHDQLRGIEHLVHVPGDAAILVEVVAGSVRPVTGIDLEAVQLLVGGVVGCNVLHVQGLHQVLDLEVVLFMEDVVDGGEAEVFVHAAIAGDVVIAHRGHQDFTHGGVNSRRKCATHDIVGLHDAEVGEIDPREERAGAREGAASSGQAGERQHAIHHANLGAGAIGRMKITVEDRDRAVHLGDLGGPGIEHLRACAREIEVAEIEMGRVEARIHVEDEGRAAGARLGARGDMAGGIAVAQVGDVFPGQIIAAGVQQLLTQFRKRRQRVTGGRAIGLVPGRLQGLAVEHLHAGVEAGATVRVFDPFAQQRGELAAGAIGLALVDEG